MFSKSKINDPAPKSDADTSSTAAPSSSAPAAPKQSEFKASAPKAKPPASVLSSDLHITGNLKTTGDIQVEGTVEGDIRAHLLTIGETATIKGEVIAAASIGKLKTLLQMLTLLLGGCIWVGWLSLDMQLPGINLGLETIWITVYWLVASVTVYSGIDYFIKGRNLYVKEL